MEREATQGSGRAPLRERKRQRTENDLRDAALQLFREKGFAATSVDEIAARANVSRSTYFRYFGSKEAVLFAEGDEFGTRFIQLLVARPAEESRVDAYEQALLELTAQSNVEDAQRHKSRLLDSLLREDPALTSRRIVELERWTNAIAEAFATRAGSDSTSTKDRLAAAACIATTEEIGRDWREANPDAVDAIRKAFVDLRKVLSSAA